MAGMGLCGVCHEPRHTAICLALLAMAFGTGEWAMCSQLHVYVSAQVIGMRVDRERARGWLEVMTPQQADKAVQQLNNQVRGVWWLLLLLVHWVVHRCWVVHAAMRIPLPAAACCVPSNLNLSLRCFLLWRVQQTSDE